MVQLLRDTVFWPPWTLGTQVVHTNTCRPNTHMHRTKIKGMEWTLNKNKAS